MREKGFIFTATVGAFLGLITLLIVMTITTSELEQSRANLMLEREAVLSDYVDSLKIEVIQSVITKTRQKFNSFLEGQVVEGVNSCGSTPVLQVTSSTQPWLFDSASSWEDDQKGFTSYLLDPGGTGQGLFRRVFSEITTESQSLSGALTQYELSPQANNSSVAGFWTGVLNEMSASPTPLVTVHDCLEALGACPNGSFTINLDFGAVTQANRVNGPQLVITSRNTGNETSISLMPDSTVNVYVPFRAFKAFSNARRVYKNLALNEDALFGDPSLNSGNGLILGACDNGCGCRRTLTSSPSVPGLGDCSGSACGDDVIANPLSFSVDTVSQGTVPVFTVSNYDCSSPGKTVFSGSRAALCAMARAEVETSADFQAISDSSATVTDLCSFTPSNPQEVDSRISAPANSPPLYLASSSVFGQASQTIDAAHPSNSSPNNSYVPEWKQKRECTGSCTSCSNTDEFLKCSKPLTLQPVYLKLRDSNPDYAVFGAADANYCFQISFNPFNNYDSLLEEADGLDLETHCTKCANSSTSKCAPGRETKYAPPGDPLADPCGTVTPSSNHLCVYNSFPAPLPSLPNPACCALSKVIGECP